MITYNDRAIQKAHLKEKFVVFLNKRVEFNRGAMVQFQLINIATTRLIWTHYTIGRL